MKQVTDRARGWIRSASIAIAVLAAAPSARAADAPASHLGVASCASGVCHGVAKPVENATVLRNEYVTWSHFDPHAGAYRTLRSDDSKRMAARLGIADPTREPLCLDCHAENVAAALRGPRFQFDDGVGCEACHGASARWIASHDDAPRVTHADNVAAGMIALERAEVRAGVCAGCHVGSAERMAGHALMAAGHPRLTFELDTYSELWRTSGGREHYRRDEDYAKRKAASDSVEVWLAGLVEAADRTLAIAGDGRHSRGVFPDFALFNCYGCHRSMKLRRFRDAPGLAPGSLRVQDSALVMLAIVLDALEPARGVALRDATTRLHRAANEGMPALRDAAAALRQEMPALRDWAAGRRPGADDRDAVLAAILAAAGRGEFPDYAAAEQAAMAVTLLLAASGRTLDSDPRIEALFADLEDDERYDPARFARILSRLR
ncbi:MAG TPA: multiheme c-type cytochrome [Steroidobacteraceae bacterium]|nr:multiheme c-type cytochrome [Steroidobacteraceae bacterium]